MVLFYHNMNLLIFRLKTIDVVIRNTKDAEDTLKSYESRLRDVSNVPAEKKEVEDHRNQLKVFPLLHISLKIFYSYFE